MVLRTECREAECKGIRQESGAKDRRQGKRNKDQYSSTRSKSLPINKKNSKGMKNANYLTAALTALAIVSCTDSDTAENTLGDDGQKTPLVVTAAIDDVAATTRATDKTFEAGDELTAYIRHVTWDGTEEGARISVTADKAPRLVTFKYNGGAMTPVDGTTDKTSDLTVDGGLYWDDFSDSQSEATDLRTDGHYLQSYYGYCYNGGETNVTTPLNEETGVIGWTVPTEQGTADIVKHADLLWSREQKPVSYSHGTTTAGVRSGLSLPYTHAMSEVTIIIKTGNGFDVKDKPLEHTSVILNGWNTQTTLNAPQKTLEASAKENITMCKGEVQTSGTAAQCTYIAMTAPLTNLSIGNTLARIMDADGNNYDIKVTEALLSPSAWGAQLDEATSETENGVAQAKGREMQVTPSGEIPQGKGYTTRSGVHYTLTVTLHKVQVQVEASISSWVDVHAATTATSDFQNDVVSFSFTDGTFSQSDAFSLYALNSNGVAKDALSAAFATAAVSSTATYNGTAKKWDCTPVLYWPNGNDALYFRAVATLKDSKYTANAEVAQGNDIVWATTAKHSGTDVTGADFSYGAGEAIKPRTGQIPLQLEHAMSRLSIQLQTVAGAAAVNLTSAKISITNLATTGVIDLATGNITAAETSKTAIDAMSAPIEELCVVPQTLTDNAVIRITLADGTTYKAQLNLCDVTTAGGMGGKITEWKRGTHYKYVITLQKEAITLSVMIKDWTETSGSGNANLDWD